MISTKKTKLVAILNLTPDSFSDGGKFNNIKAALQQTENFIKDGADIIDIGAESTRPGAKLIDQQEEWQRLKDFLPQIINLSHANKVKVSLDSRHYNNIKKGLDLGVDIINDVAGFHDQNMVELASKYQKQLILMHNLGIPADKNIIIDQHLDVIEELICWAKNKLCFLIENGIKKENIIFDPGVGFGKNSNQSLAILNKVEEFCQLDVPIFIGHSRKSFLGDVVGNDQKDLKTAEISQSLMKKGVSYLRVHNIKIHSKILF